MEHLTESTKQIGHNSPKPLRTKRYHLRSENDETNSKKHKRNPIKQQTERCVKMTKNQR